MRTRSPTDGPGWDGGADGLLIKGSRTGTGARVPGDARLDTPAISAEAYLHGSQQRRN